MIASGTTVRTSTKPAARAWSRSGGTPALGASVVVATMVKSAAGAGDASPGGDPPQAVPHTATSRPARSHRTICTSALSRVAVPLGVHRGDPEISVRHLADSQQILRRKTVLLQGLDKAPRAA